MLEKYQYFDNVLKLQMLRYYINLSQPTNIRIPMDSRTYTRYVHTLFLVSCVSLIFLPFLPESSLAQTQYDKHEFHHYIKKSWH